MQRRVMILGLSICVAACGSAAPGAAGSSPSANADDAAAVTTEPSGGSLPAPAAAPADASPTALASDVSRAPVDLDAPVGAVVAGMNDAGFALMRTLPADSNIVFSPASIGHALLMAEPAADQATRDAIRRVFGLPDGAHEAWNSIDQTIAAAQSDDVTVTIADRIWPQQGIEPDQAWIDLLASRHGADVVPLDFGADPESSRQVINGWVGERTEGLIPELFPEGSIRGNTVLALTDAVYFAANWALPFGKYGTVDQTFTTADGAEFTMSFMRELELADRRGQGDGFSGAEIPYAGNDFSMLVLVPDDGDVTSFRDRLDQTLLDNVDASFVTGPFELLLPKWDDSFAIDLMPWLREVGAAPGEYPGIAPGVFLDAAVHAADIAVDEMGTVAAAATGLAFAESGPPEPEFTIAADRPFVYLIRHRSSGLVLFVGEVSDPR